MQPKILDREIAYSGYLSIERLRVQLPDGAKVWRDVERHGDAAVVLPYDSERRCALIVRLFRAPVFDVCGEAASEEACAGMIEDAEAAEVTARREAMEELGVALSCLEPVANVWSSPGVSTERQWLFLAPYGLEDRSGKGGGVASEHEDITVVERPLAELAADARQLRTTDGKLMTLVLALQLRRPDLFEGSGDPLIEGSRGSSSTGTRG
jgi:nudix-type nucleoside diphosphatase (YffH/AdpP family)